MRIVVPGGFISEAGHVLGHLEPRRKLGVVVVVVGVCPRGFPKRRRTPASLNISKERSGANGAARFPQKDLGCEKSSPIPPLFSSQKRRAE